jgi:hypothetical protein
MKNYIIFFCDRLIDQEKGKIKYFRILEMKFINIQLLL